MPENTLYDIKNDITLKNIITYNTQFNLNNVILSTNFSHIYEEWDYVQRDNEVMKLIPEKYANHICIKSTSNGNCFFNSTSLIAFGHKDNHMQLHKALDNINMETQNNSFKKAILHRPIESLFPQTGNTFMNQIYNRIIMPRQGDHFYPHCIIMWSSISAEDFQSSGKSNHFVPVFKRKEYEQSIEQSPLIQEVLSLQNNHNDLTADKTNNEHITDSEVDPNTIIVLFMGIDSDFIPNIDKIGDYLIYSDAKDFQFEISYQKALKIGK
ncbi:hypothetical protein RhiirA4_466193 [Rhizophagus irregularis]|uniref:Vertnin n=1 Tax=Rhizophagus irregularis TaxID=588596 RepID=A0A2I1GTK8_9GLOM|nr:hypothetical protein RhiirA4_466193 [Rhizophagus irregularis]